MTRVNFREHFNRRELIAGAAATVSLAAIPGGSPFATDRDAPNARRVRAFDDDWRFLRSDIQGGESVELDASSWRQVQLPHDWSIEDLPGAPRTTGAWQAPVATWTVTRVPAKTGSIPFIRMASWPEPSPDGPPLRVGPFDPAASAGTWGTGWTVGGIGWYRKRFTAPAMSADERVVIQFDGAFGETEIWLNGKRIGASVYGYAAFAFEITEHLRATGPNVVAVRVANDGETARWYSGSGLNRHVWLTVTGPVRIAPWGVAVATPRISAQSADVQIEVDVENHIAGETGIELHALVREARGRTVAEGQSRIALPAAGPGQARIALSLPRPKLWSPDDPQLYSAEVSLRANGRVTDRATTRFAVRSIEVSAARGLTINGQSVKLKGACIHYDHGILGAVAIDRAERRKAELLKQHGYNAVRLAHHMFPPAFLDACDELGMLVVDEVFDVWEKPKFRNNDYSKHFKQHWRHDLTCMIRQDRNHPSVIFWSIGNEIPERNEPRGVEIAAELRAAVLALDTSRPITAAINGPTGKEGESSRRSLDVVGYNYQQSFYEADHGAYPQLVFMSTEQFAKEIHDGWRKVEAYPWLIGEFVWTGIDYLGEVGAGSSILLPTGTSPPLEGRTLAIFLWDYPAYQSGCGEIDILGHRKAQGLYRDVLWGRSSLELLVQRPTPPGTYEWLSFWGWHDELESWTWDEPAGKPMTVRAYTHGDEVRLLLDGIEIGRKPVAPTDKLIAEFEVLYKPGELVAIALRNGKEIGRKKLMTVGAPTKLRLRAERSSIGATPNELAYVFAEVLDAHGRKVPDAAVPLLFALEGPARLRATGSANPRGLKSFSDPNCTTFHGEALAIIQPASQRGRAVLHVRSPGLAGDSIALEIG